MIDVVPFVAFELFMFANMDSLFAGIKSSDVIVLLPTEEGVSQRKLKTTLLLAMPSLATDPPRADAGSSLPSSASFCPGCQKSGVPLLQCDDPTPAGETRARWVMWFVLPLNQYSSTWEYMSNSCIEVFMDGILCNYGFALMILPTLKREHHSTMMANCVRHRTCSHCTLTLDIP